jgi:hypothetical protein
MNPIEIQKEIIKLGGIREIYKSCRDIDSIFGKKKAALLRDVTGIACYTYNREEPKIKELLENMRNIKFDEYADDYKEYSRKKQEANKAYCDYVNNGPTPMYKIKDDFILYLSRDDYSKSHAKYYSPILMEALGEIDKIIPYENYSRLERKEEIELYKKIVEILLKFDCIEKELLI